MTYLHIEELDYNCGAPAKGKQRGLAALISLKIR